MNKILRRGNFFGQENLAKTFGFYARPAVSQCKFRGWEWRN